MGRFLHLWWWKGLLLCWDCGYGFWRNVWCWMVGRHNSPWHLKSNKCLTCGAELG